MSFAPHLFISVGATGAFYTLRETYEHETYIRGGGPMGGAVVNGVYQGQVHREVRSLHHFNLSQNLDEAISKAEAFAESAGLELRFDRDTLGAEMRTIERASAEALERRKREQEEREAAWAAEREAAQAERLAMLAKGIFPVGPYRGKEFREAPRDYLTWLGRGYERFEEGSIMRTLGLVVALKVPELLLPEPHPELHLGEPKKRLSFRVTVVRSAYFDRPAYGSYDRYERVYVTTMVESVTGACLVVKSPSFSAEPGAELTIKGTVKEHTEYKGQAQTVLQRVVVE
ncbi:hypothetical protein 19_00005 [Pseudomonas phage Epa19]|nr:hypothetical protein 19_00005 [Pseudomonas phage Epa19]